MGLLSYMKPKKGSKGPDEHAIPAVQPETSMSTAAPTPGTMTPGAWSRPASIYPVGDFRNSQSEDLNEVKCDVMVNWLYQQQMERLWTAGGIDEGVVLKKSRGQYTCCPNDILDEPYGFFKAVEALNVRVSTGKNDRSTSNTNV